MVYIKFNSVSNLEYFLSHTADHMDWLSLYSCKKISEDTLYFNDSLLGLIEPTKKNIGLKDSDCIKNKKIMFSKNSDLDGNGGVSFYEDIKIY